MVGRYFKLLLTFIFTIIVAFSLVILVDGWYDPSLIDNKLLNIKEYV